MEAPGVEPSGDNKHGAGLRAFSPGFDPVASDRVVVGRVATDQLGNEWATGPGYRLRKKAALRSMSF